jgi:D-amino-acid oxidase
MSTPSARSARPPVLVVGAGVIGLSCAIRLAEADFAVEVLARELPAETTSAVAGALWLPYRAEPADRVAEWGRATLAELLRLKDAVPDAGVLVRSGVIVRHEPMPTPSWAGAVADLAQLRAVAAPMPGYSHGVAMRVPLVDMPRYLDYLATRLQRAGGQITRADLAALPERGIVVNACGVDAARLVGDQQVHPVRGQTVVLANPGLTDWFVDEDEVDGEFTYVLPRAHDVVVGGSATEHDWNRGPDPALAERILARAVVHRPELGSARVLAHRVGLRPARSTVRLEAQPRADGVVVHCYGHGGAGVTLSWGCADEVLAAVLDWTSAGGRRTVVHAPVD